MKYYIEENWKDLLVFIVFIALNFFLFSYFYKTGYSDGYEKGYENGTHDQVLKETDAVEAIFNSLEYDCKLSGRNCP